MTSVRLTMAITAYDHVADLAFGSVRPVGIDLQTLTLPIEDIFQRFERHREWDVSEFSFAKYVAAIASGDRSLSAIPVFPSRMFRTGAVFVRAGSELVDPEQLRGCRVGVPEWVQTAGIYLRAWLAHDVGVPLEAVSWVQGGVNRPGRRETVQPTLPPGVRIEVERERSLEALLLAGEIDAIATAHPPAAFERRDGTIRQLLADPRAVAWESWRRTGVHPIMHAIVLRRECLVSDPWIGAHLFRAFCEARDRSVERMLDLTASRVPIPFAQEAAVDAADRMGELFPYGVVANATTLNHFLGAAYEQGITTRRVELRELFHPGCEDGAYV